MALFQNLEITTQQEFLGIIDTHGTETDSNRGKLYI